MFAAMSKFTIGSLEHVAKAGTLAEEVIGSIRTMHAFGTSLILGKKFDEYITDSRNTGRKGSIIEAFGLSIMCKSKYVSADNSLVDLLRIRPGILLRWYPRHAGPRRCGHRHQRLHVDPYRVFFRRPPRS